MKKTLSTIVFIFLATITYAQVLIPTGYKFYNEPGDEGYIQTRIKNERSTIRISEFATGRTILDIKDPAKALAMGLQISFGNFSYEDYGEFYAMKAPELDADGDYFMIMYCKDLSETIVIKSQHNNYEFKNTWNWIGREIKRHPKNMDLVWVL